jgi:hypothetical protein
MLPHIPPNIQLVKGRIIDVGTSNIDHFDQSSPTFEMAALNNVSNIGIGRTDRPPEGLLLAPFYPRVH